MVTKDDFFCDFENKWCPGCGNFQILDAMKDTFTRMNLAPENLLIVSGIGQAGKTPHFLKCNYFHGLHGRALPVATGAKIADHELTVVVSSGDGDCYGEGGNHFISAVRRNIDITLLVHNNKVYGLTKGQASPTSDKGFTTKMQPGGVIAEPFNPLTVALSLGAGFVARGFSGARDHLARLIRAAMTHRGFAMIDILQPCPSFNRVNSHAWYKRRVVELPDPPEGANDLEAAFVLARKWGDRIPIGILYQKQGPTYTDRLEALRDGPLCHFSYDKEKVAKLIAG
ncbi:MAG: 2-oxoacid ferredoxin oxidoreductase [Desulfobacterales bacterium CG23_combo_of_CG06-09_8_20_14_all_51_8]|nr:MAG: 2-oxoacid ferredoxin oxidoreductase [Desulfobacterales bacterium CG23_combo_of_CG06-09_8_20_14_all_51_8]